VSSHLDEGPAHHPAVTGDGEEVEVVVEVVLLPAHLPHRVRVLARLGRAHVQRVPALSHLKGNEGNEVKVNEVKANEVKSMRSRAMRSRSTSTLQVIALFYCNFVGYVCLRRLHTGDDSTHVCSM
jgi:hypothetical protein